MSTQEQLNTLDKFHEICAKFLFRSPDLGFVRDHLKAIGISSDDARELNLGFSPGRISFGEAHIDQWSSQLVKAGFSSFQPLLDTSIMRRREHGKYYMCFRDCLIRPFHYDDGPFVGDIAGLVGISLIGPDLFGFPLVVTSAGEVDREMSDYDVVVEWAHDFIFNSEEAGE
jgi:hypothetical protein